MKMMSVNEALRAVLAEIHRLKKGDKNDHGKYAYVSVDDVKDHVRPILAKHGLHVSVCEVSFDLVGVESRNGVTTSARISYDITLRHVSGEALPPDRITILLPYTGAQTAGAARSYAVKEWMKSTLLVSTGEKDAIVGGTDADAYEQQDYTAPVQKSSYRARKEDGPAFEEIQKGLGQIQREGSLEDLVRYWKGKNVQDALKTMKKDWHDSLVEMKDEIKAKFEEGHRKPLAPSPAEYEEEQAA
jgi:hypothetical protein